MSRILAPRSRYDEIAAKLTEAFAAMKVGDPLEEDTIVGPLISEAHRERVLGFVEKAVEEGATVATGGKAPEHLDKGWYVEPTLLTNVSNDMTVAQEEVFGPVIALIPYEDEEDAIRIANDSRFGLAGCVFTSDPVARLRGRPPGAQRHVLGQHLRRGLQLAVRRLQGVRDRPRARPDGDRGVPPLQDDLGRPLGRAARGRRAVGRARARAGLTGGDRPGGTTWSPSWSTATSRSCSGRPASPVDRSDGRRATLALARRPSLSVFPSTEPSPAMARQRGT